MLAGIFPCHETRPRGRGDRGNRRRKFGGRTFGDERLEIGERTLLDKGMDDVEGCAVKPNDKYFAQIQLQVGILSGMIQFVEPLILEVKLQKLYYHHLFQLSKYQICHLAHR